jgi:Mn2+/Fe2+ NRAMP family transporter
MAAGAGGAGELLFPPRVGSLYGYAFLWAIVAAVVLKWFINHEIGRFSTCTGETLLDGFKKVPGPKNWAVWLIVLPQLFVAVGAIAGLSGSAATALILVFPGDNRLWMAVILLTTMVFLLWGKYKKLEQVASFLAIALALAAIVTAITVFPNISALTAGLVPQLPANTNYGEIVPWLSFVLAGAAGMTWYSYWIAEKGYGAAEYARSVGEAVNPREMSTQERQGLRGWLSIMTLDLTLGVIGGLLIVMAFLILGTELLRPQGLVPAENRVAEVLGTLLGDVWGPVGYWFMIVAVFTGFWQTVLTNQDGWARLFADGTNIILQPFNLHNRWTNEGFLRKAYIVGLLTVIPIAVYWIVGEPVGLLQITGIIEAAHIPFIAWLTLYLNYRGLPKGLRPSKFTLSATAIAGLFFAVFAAIYILQSIGIIGGGSSS